MCMVQRRRELLLYHDTVIYDLEFSNEIYLQKGKLIMEKVIVLNYVGNDSFSRPVYENDGKLYVDVEPLSDCEPNICTKMYNRFNGEPDTSIRDMKKYEGVKVEFNPKRIVWR